MSDCGSSQEFLFEKTHGFDFSAHRLYYGGFDFRALYRCLFCFERKRHFIFYCIGLYFMVFSAFQDVSVKTLVFFQGLSFTLFCAGILYFNLSWSSFLFGFGLGQIFALTSLWLGKRLFSNKINLATVVAMVFKWGVFGFILFLVLENVDKVAFTVGLSGLFSFWMAFALGSKR